MRREKDEREEQQWLATFSTLVKRPNIISDMRGKGCRRDNYKSHVSTMNSRSAPNMRGMVAMKTGWVVVKESVMNITD